MPKSARRPAKPAPKKPAPKKAAAKKVAAKKAPAARTSAPVAPAAPDTLAAQLAEAAGLSREELLTRALRSFAAAHGIALAEAAPAAAPAAERAESTPQPAPAAPARADHAPAADETPSLAPDRRLYVHGIGRPPVEMIADHFVIGSSPKSDLWVNSTGIETRHLRIDRVGGKYYATDLNTAKGTVLHGQPVTGAVEIQHEDTFYLAGYHRVRMYVIE